MNYYCPKCCILVSDSILMIFERLNFHGDPGMVHCLGRGNGTEATYSISTAVLMEVRESTSKSILTLGTEDDVLGILVDEDGPTIQN